MADIDNKGRFTSGNKKGNTFSSTNQPLKTGRPKSKRKELRTLLKDLKYEYLSKDKDVTPLLKTLVYDLYKITLSDFDLSTAKKINFESSLKHLYFIKSSFGIKIGVSKNINKRLLQIKRYAKDVELVKVIKYAGEYEKIIHQKFNNLNIKDNKEIGIEWFYINDDLESWISELDSLQDLILEFGKENTKKLCVQLKLF
jgi:hypothetical protein